MYRIIGKRGSGKTSQLLLLAKENNGIIVCGNPASIRTKSENYGIFGIDIISYTDFFAQKYDTSKSVYIDDLDVFLKYIGYNKINGYTLSNDD